MKKVMPALQVVTVAGLSCILAACTSLQSQMNSFDGDMRSCAGREQWHSAYKVVTGAQFECEPHEEPQIEEWRKAEIVQLKALFSRSLQSTVNEANSYYSKGDLANGDKVRQGLKEKYFGGKVNDEVARMLPQWVAGGNAESGIPECLTPCMELALVQMLSDRNLSRMIRAFRGYIKRIEGIDVNGGKKSIKEFDGIADSFKKVFRWKDKVDLFMKKLADGDTPRWSAIDRSTYALQIGKMEAVRNQLLVAYRTKRWNTRVADRKADYAKIAKYNAIKDYRSAIQLMNSHDVIIMPTGLVGAVDFDDQAERAAVASGGLVTEIVKGLFESRQTGVLCPRKSRKGIYSVLVIGRAPIKGDKSIKKNLRDAERSAQMQAWSEFAQFIETSIEVESSKISLEDGRSDERFKSVSRARSKADVSNLVTIATGVDGDEVVMILGWRDPEAGNITPSPMCRMSGFENFILSPSVGAYL